MALVKIVGQSSVQLRSHALADALARKPALFQVDAIALALDNGKKGLSNVGI